MSDYLLRKKEKRELVVRNMVEGGISKALKDISMIASENGGTTIIIQKVVVNLGYADSTGGSSLIIGENTIEKDGVVVDCHGYKGGK